MHMANKIPSRHSTTFTTNFRPRVERNVPMSIYMRAIPDHRPGSIAWATPENMTGSVSIGLTMSKTMSQSSFFSSTSVVKSPGANFEKPTLHTPMGERRNLFEVKRVGDNHFTFSQGASVLDPGPGVIRDRDSVQTAASRLRMIYPDALPDVVSMGDAAVPGMPPTRPVRNVFAAKGTMLLESDSIGVQCQRTDFRKYYPPKVFFAPGLATPR